MAPPTPWANRCNGVSPNTVRASAFALRVAHLLTPRRRDELDLLLVPDAYLGRTPLAWLGIGPTSSSPAAKAELEKRDYLRRLDAHTLDLSALPEQQRRFLAGVGRRLTGQALQRREPERRYPILLTLLAHSAVDVLDEVLLSAVLNRCSEPHWRCLLGDYYRRPFLLNPWPGGYGSRWVVGTGLGRRRG